MKSYKNGQKVNAEEIKEIIGSRKVCVTENGDFWMVSASDIDPDDSGVIVVRGGSSELDRYETSLFIDIDGCMIHAGECNHAVENDCDLWSIK